MTRRTYALVLIVAALLIGAGVAMRGHGQELWRHLAAMHGHGGGH